MLIGFPRSAQLPSNEGKQIKRAKYDFIPFDCSASSFLPAVVTGKGVRKRDPACSPREPFWTSTWHHFLTSDLHMFLDNSMPG